MVTFQFYECQEESPAFAGLSIKLLRCFHQDQHKDDSYAQMTADPILLSFYQLPLKNSHAQNAVLLFP
jgi:hypothetical protein